MGLSLQNLRDGILRATATDVTDWTNGNADLDLYIQKSWWDISDQFDFREKEAPILSIPTIAATRSYNIPALTGLTIFDALQRLSIIDPVTLEHNELPLIQDFTYENEQDDDTGTQAKPTNYFRRNNLLYLYPTPDKVYSLQLYYLQIIGDIASGGPIIPQSWHEIIELGAKYRALFDTRDDYRGQEHMKMQEKLINGRTPVKAKELADTKFAGVEIPGRDY